MDKSQTLDALFQEAVSALDAGNIQSLERLLTNHPRLVHERLTTPGEWLRNQVGSALDGFFQTPYLLWFVAEDPTRTGCLPSNRAEMTRLIIQTAQREGVESLQEQLDYTLRLVSWSVIARECGVQIALIDVLIEAGAAPDGNANNALVNGNFAAAAHLVEKGDPLTLATALCLERWGDIERLASAANAEGRLFGLILAALNGKAEAVARVLPLGVEVNAPCADLYPHAIAIHHAVSSGSLDTVKILVEAGADLAAKDTAFGGTPSGWAEYCRSQQKSEERKEQYVAIATYLHEQERHS